MQTFQDTPFIIEKKRRSKPKGGRIAAVLLLFFGAVAVGIVVFFSFNRNTFTIKGRSLYAVRLFSSETEAEALDRATAVKKAGGSGYIYNDGVYSVLAAIYPSEEDARTVAERNAGEVVEIKIVKVKLKIYKDVAVSQSVSDCARYAFTALFDALYKAAVELDSKTLSESAAAFRIADCKNKLLDVGNAVDELLQQFPSDAALLKIKNAYLDAASYLEKVSEAGDCMQVKVKYAACAVAVRFQTLFAGL